MNWVIRSFKDHPVYTIVFWTLIIPAVIVTLSTAQLLGLIDWLSGSKFNLKDRFTTAVTKPYTNRKRR